MVNFNLNLASIVGIALVIGGAALYAVRTVRPELARDYDIFFAAVALLSGAIFFFQGWRFDPIMQFGQILLGGSAIFFAFESVRLRSVTAEQAKRNTPIVDDERPVSRVYRAELDNDLSPLDDQPPARRIRGARGWDEDYEDEAPRRRPASDRLGPATSRSASRPTSRRRPRLDERPAAPEEWDEEVDDEPRPSRSQRSLTSRSSSRNSPPARPPRRSRSSEDYGEPRSPETNSGGSDYVDYRPVSRASEDDDGTNDKFEY